MKANEILKIIMKEQDITQEQFSKIVGMKSQSAVSGVLNRNMRISTLARLVKALDGKIIIKHNGQEFEVTE